MLIVNYMSGNDPSVSIISCTTVPPPHYPPLASFSDLVMANPAISLDWPLTQFEFIGHCARATGSFCVFGPVLSSPAHAPPSLAMPQRRIEVIFVL
jgi:hypothetical protein